MILRTQFTGLLCCAVVVCLTVCSAIAATPAEYKQRVESARMSVEEMLSDLDESDTELEREIVADIRKDVPPTETISWPGGSVETDNRWLETMLNDLLERRETKPRTDLLINISERLLAVAESADNLAKAVESSRSKDEDKQKLAEILRREEYQKPEVREESLFQKWWREFTEWLSRVFPKPSLEPGTPSSFGSLQFGLQILIFAIVIALVGFLLYRFLPAIRGRLGSKTKKTNGDRVILGERIGVDQSANDLFSEAEQLARDGDLRAAIRKGYIALLCDLSDRKLVRLARHKTNRDYLRDVRKNEAVFENMRGMTTKFEANWYGLRPAEQNDWEDFRSGYRKTIEEAR